MEVVLGVVGGLLLCKLVWNASVPYVLFVRLRKAPEQRTKGISLFLALEWVLLAMAVCTSTQAEVEGWGPLRVAVIGGGAIIFSYVHLAVIGFLLGWLGSKTPRVEPPIPVAQTRKGYPHIGPRSSDVASSWI